MNHGHEKACDKFARRAGACGEAVIKARRNTYDHAMMGRHP